MKSLHYLWLFGLAGLACGSEPQSTYEDVNLYKGSVRVVWVDVLDAKGSHQEVWFEEDGGDSYELAFDEGIPYVLNSGDHVEFEGVLEDSGVLVPWVETFHHEAFLPNLRRAATTQENVLVIPVNVGTKSVTFASGCSMTEVKKLYSTNSDSVANFYDEASESQLDVTIDFGNAVSIPAPSTSCDVRTISTWADAAYLAANGSKSMKGYTRKAYIIPQCGSWAGLAEVGYVGGTSKLWMADTYACWELAMAHELGHSFGMHHSSTPTSEYGDISDVMGAGGSISDFHGAHSVQMGWVPASQIEDAKQGTEYELASLDSTDSTSVKVLRFTDSSGQDYYASYRTAEELSVHLVSKFEDRVSVHRGPSGRGNTLLVDVLDEADVYAFSDSKMPDLTFDEIDGDLAVVTVGGTTSTGGGTTTGAAPLGQIARAATQRANGWVYDPDSPYTSVKVDVHVDGTSVVTWTASKKHSKWKKLFPSAGAYHKFLGSFGRQSKGLHTVEVYARDVDSSGKETGSTTLLKPTWSFTNRR